MPEAKLWRIEIDGDPKTGRDARHLVRLVYADHADLAQATVSVTVQVLSEAGYNDALGEVEKAALLQAKQLIEQQILLLGRLEIRSRLNDSRIRR